MTKAIELSQLGSSLDVGTEIELSTPLRTNNAAYGNNINVPYLIAGTPGYTGATTTWNTFGLQHRFKSNNSGAPRLTVDSKNGELFCIKNDGKIGVGTTDPFSELDVHSSAFTDITVSSARTTGNIGGLNFRKDTGGTPALMAQVLVTTEGHYSFRAGGATDFYHAFSIKADGNVGVGTDNPATKFAVHGVTSIGNGAPSTGAGIFSVKPHNSQDNYFKIRPASDFVSGVTGSVIDLRDAANASSKQLIIRADRYRLWTSDEKITVTSSGLIGINETNPGHFIDMNIGTTNIGMKMTSADAGSYIQFADNSTSGVTKIGAEGDNFVFDVNDNDNSVFIKGNGNVGIGTDNPGSKLHIQGTSRQVAGSFSDNITYGGRTFTTNHDIQSTSMRGGVLVRNMNDFRSETNAASFMHYDAYDTTAKSYAFRAARGATLSDTFWVKSDGSVYSSGNVGFGVANPACKIDMTGHIEINGSAIAGILTTGVADDAYVDVTPPIKGGHFIITPFSSYDTYPQPIGGGIVYYDVGASRLLAVVVDTDQARTGGVAKLITGGAVTSSSATDFTDNAVTVTTPSGGTLRIFNRTGSSRRFKITFL